MDRVYDEESWVECLRRLGIVRPVDQQTVGPNLEGVVVASVAPDLHSPAPTQDMLDARHL